MTETSTPMLLCATREYDYRTWDYLIGNFHHGRSIGLERFEHLRMLNDMSENTLKLSLIDRDDRSRFTKWRPWYRNNWEWKSFDIQTAYDVQRSILENEIVIESDYPSYEKNAEAARMICKILEQKGFIPHIYYSGSKSCHVHVYLSWKFWHELREETQSRIRKDHVSETIFKKKFMNWLRQQMIGCWGLRARVFDEQLVKATHLIRAELSKNKRGYKTFLGYTHKDITPFPLICNEDTHILPDLGEIHVSNPICMQDIVEEYIQTCHATKKKATLKRKEQSLKDFFNPREETTDIKGCVQFMLSDDFKNAGDGYKRAMFFIYNELVQVHGEGARQEVLSWNNRMGDPVREQEITARFTSGGTYHLGHATIHDFLKSIGFKDADAICTHNETEKSKV